MYSSSVQKRRTRLDLSFYIPYHTVTTRYMYIRCGGKVVNHTYTHITRPSTMYRTANLQYVRSTYIHTAQIQYRTFRPFHPPYSQFNIPTIICTYGRKLRHIYVLRTEGDNTYICSTGRPYIYTYGVHTYIHTKLHIIDFPLLTFPHVCDTTATA